MLAWRATEKHADLIRINPVANEIGQAEISVLGEYLEFVKRRFRALRDRAQSVGRNLSMRSNIGVGLARREKPLDDRGHQLAFFMPDSHRRICSTCSPESRRPRPMIL